MIAKCVIIWEQFNTESSELRGKNTMNAKQMRVMPENRYHIKYGIKLDEILTAYRNNLAITARVEEVNVQQKLLRVSLGDDFYGYMDWKDASLYPFTYKYNDIPDQLHNIKDQKVRVKVKRITKAGKIFLTRKACMIEAWQEIINLPKDTVIDASEIRANSAAVFYDIGSGITAYCPLREFTSTRMNLKKWVRYGDVDRVVIDTIDESKMQISCSRKRADSRNYSSFAQYDIVDVRLGDPVYDGDELTGYFGEITPNVCCIADVPYIKRSLEYGETVKACIGQIKVDKRQMKLSIL